MQHFISKGRISIPAKLTPYLFLFPSLFVLGITVFLPAFQAFYLTFTNITEIGGTPEWVGFKNFIRLWNDRIFWQTLGNTLLYITIVVPILVVIPLGLAILVNQKLRGITWFRAAFYSPVVISMVVAGIAWGWLYEEKGLINSLLKSAGIVKEGINWLDPRYAIFSVMAVTVWKGLGYYMVIYLAGLQSIPADLYEAASIDGSDGIRKHLDITLPLMKPYLALVCVMSAISATKVFEEIYIMIPGARNSSKTIVYYLYEQAFNNLEISYACTIGLVLFFIIMVLSILQLLFSRVTKHSIG
ncbi:carbohydrate ABC transporter permease [Calothrix sp. PCC 6303]|uniref:carbohydrate ABC transporter permease n=1 Tax=Calothrix sp. PCC 6303 TaxID=1170562 RepID=UPI0002A0096A|nr:sugar ABC transporter permease [Calothrix sp. PCC 6303]AFZ00175.1 carbohydrate ABC transporter membrane protein 1, CUT1 family [Calothrix sp. PCC 6303]